MKFDAETGALGSFIHKLPANKSYTAKEVFEKFLLKKKYSESLLRNPTDFLIFIEKRLKIKQRRVRNIYEELK